MTEKMQASLRQRRQPLIVRCCLNILNIAELGFSNAVIYNMYKPIAENDTDKVCALMKFYKTIYRVIGLTVWGIGLLILSISINQFHHTSRSFAAYTHLFPKIKIFLILGNIKVDICQFVNYILCLALPPPLPQNFPKKILWCFLDISTCRLRHHKNPP